MADDIEPEVEAPAKPAAPAKAEPAAPEITDDMPRWMKYRIANGLPIEDAAPEGDAQA